MRLWTGLLFAAVVFKRERRMRGISDRVSPLALAKIIGPLSLSRICTRGSISSAKTLVIIARLAIRRSGVKLNVSSNFRRDIVLLGRQFLFYVLYNMHDRGATYIIFFSSFFFIKRKRARARVHARVNYG